MAKILELVTLDQLNRNIRPGYRAERFTYGMSQWWSRFRPWKPTTWSRSGVLAVYGVPLARLDLAWVWTWSIGIMTVLICPISFLVGCLAFAIKDQQLFEMAIQTASICAVTGSIVAAVMIAIVAIKKRQLES